MYLRRAAALLVLLGVPVTVSAHPMLQEFVVHEVGWSRQRDCLELTVVLTFFERPSMMERVRMDADRDGQVTSREADAYTRLVEATAAKGIQVSVDGRPLPVALLVLPELVLPEPHDLLAGHHRLQLRFFARLPDDAHGHSAVRVQDCLWPAFPALGGRAWNDPRGLRSRVFEGRLDGTQSEVDTPGSREDLSSAPSSLRPRSGASPREDALDRDSTPSTVYPNEGAEVHEETDKRRLTGRSAPS